MLLGLFLRYVPRGFFRNLIAVFVLTVKMKIIYSVPLYLVACVTEIIVY